MKNRLFRAIIVGLVWVVFQSATASYIHGNSIGQLIANHLPLGGLFFLIVLVLIVNPILRVINDKSGFSVSELVVIWTVISAASAVPGYGMMEFLFTILVAPIILPHLNINGKRFCFHIYQSGCTFLIQVPSVPFTLVSPLSLGRRGFNRLVSGFS